jgi:uncharacterized protein (DUF1800 family)
LKTAALASALTGCAQIARRLPKQELPATFEPVSIGDDSVRLLNRAGYGPRPGEAAEVAKQGHESWLEAQLSRKLGEDPRLTAQLYRLDVLRVDGMELHDFPEDVMVAQLNQAALLRAAYSGDQVFERMVDFWGNHFNIYARKGLAAYRKARDDREVIRKNALGSFPDMLRASAKSPAMLAYLDNQFSDKSAPNENYARELMELHTLGVHAGYTQHDVHEVARCFTGWSIEHRFLRAKGTFLFDESRHDMGEKVVLGHRIPAGNGVEDGERVLDILATHPKTASFIAGKLCRSFLGDKDSPLKSRLAKTYLNTGGDIKSMLRQLFLSKELLEGPPVAKRPFDYVVSCLRATNAESDCGAGLQTHLVSMGQSLFEWPMPDGYPDGAQPWMGSLLARWNFAYALSEGRIAGTDLDLEDLAKRQAATGPANSMSLALLARAKAPPKIAGSLPEAAAEILASPEFQWR